MFLLFLPTPACFFFEESSYLRRRPLRLFVVFFLADFFADRLFVVRFFAVFFAADLLFVLRRFFVVFLEADFLTLFRLRVVFFLADFFFVLLLFLGIINLIDN